MEADSNSLFYLAGSLLVALVIALMLFRRSRRAIRKAIRWFFYSNPAARLLRNSILQKYVPGVVALYYIAIGVWKDSWPFFSNHIDAHEKIFLGLIVISLFLVVVQATTEHYERRGSALQSRFERAFAKLTSKIVKAKLERFKASASLTTPTGNTFRQITKPEEQINLILTELVDLLSEQFGINESDQCISIMREDKNTYKWFFPYVTNRTWKHTKPSILVSASSTARQCIDTGEPVLHVDKIEAASRGQYFYSERDKRKRAGSVFCYPSKTEMSNYTDVCVISIVTYGKMICDPIDEEHTKAVKQLLCEVCKRIDLELTLESIKFWQFEFNGKKGRERA